MSKLSTWFHQASDFMDSVFHSASPEGQVAIGNASDALKTAATQIEAALPVLVKAAVDAILASIGYGKYIPNMNELIDMLILELQNRKTVPPASPPKG